MNETEYRESLINNIQVLNELISKVNKKNNQLYTLLFVGFVVIVCLLLLCIYINNKRNNDLRNK
jgi:ABC-type microcin C transport system permease subunit YejE